jgi:hypothetical protein
MIRVLDLGALRAFLTSDRDGIRTAEVDDVTIDLTTGSPVVNITGASGPPSDGGFGRLVELLAPGLAVDPPPISHTILVEESRLAVAFTTTTATTLGYAHAEIGPIPSGVDVTIQIVVSGNVAVGSVRLSAPMSLAAKTMLGWIDDTGLTLEVYPTDAPLLALSATCDTVIEYDPEGDRAPRFLLMNGEAAAVRSTPPSQSSRRLPILTSDDPAQSLTVSVTEAGLDQIDLSVDIASQAIGTPPIQLVGRLSLDTEHLALAVTHNTGVELRVADGSGSVTWGTAPFRWKADNPTGPIFRLITANANHRIVPAPDTTITAEYAGIGDKPLRFEIERFTITPKGVEADGRVLDDPIVLNGVNTTFRFTDGAVEVRESQLADFSVMGSGPLPPALVGDAMADVVIRFSERIRGGARRVVPVSAGARLTEDQPLYSPAVMFGYAVDGLDLDFRDVGSAGSPEYHFFFTLSGEAGFSPPASFPSDNLLADLISTGIGIIGAPIAGDGSRLVDLIDFRIDLAEVAVFSVLGCFEMTIGSVGFLPEYDAFGGDPGLELVGQISFADGEGDKAVGAESRHTLVIGAPEPGSILPRVHLAELSVVIEKGDAFKLDVTVSFTDNADMKGFEGEGTIEIQGLPSLAVAVGFMRVRRSDDTWVKAWFIAANVGKLTLRIPVVEIYLREIGLGFGYRYTLTSIAALDETDDLGALIAQLRQLSRTAGDLATRDAWSISIEEPDRDPRWTIALRALFSQTAAPTSTPIRWDKVAEEQLASAFLFDVVAAVRSDLTILLAVRAWINTNYHDYVTDDNDEIRGNPLFSGFAVLEPRKQRFLAQLASNPDGHLGSRPALPEFVQEALRAAQVSVTILIEPNLFHAELGWPNLLRWQMNFGPMQAQVRAGLIYRLAQRVENGRRSVDLVLGISYVARASLRFEAGVDIGIAGVSLVATADAAFGARFIGAARIGAGEDRLDVYGGVGVDIRIRIELQVWLNLLFFTKRWRMSLEMQFSASLEFGMISRAASTQLGIEGRGTLRIKVIGKSFEVNARIAANPGTVAAARLATARYMTMGLEPSDEDVSVPGAGSVENPTKKAPAAVMGHIARNIQPTGPPEPHTDDTEDLPDASLDEWAGEATQSGSAEAEGAEDAVTTPQPAPIRSQALSVPGYSAFRVDSGTRRLFALYPADGTGGFFPVPVAEGSAGDFELSSAFPTSVGRWDPHQEAFIPVGAEHSWSARWDTVVVEADEITSVDPGQAARSLTLGDYVTAAFCDGRDPIKLDVGAHISDPRVKNPDESAYETAVRGAIEQFRSSPLFKRDPESTYEQALWAALHPGTSIYHESGTVGSERAAGDDMETARQLRGMIVEEMISDVREFVRLGADSPEAQALARTSPAFLLGLVFSAEPDAEWLGDPAATTGVVLRQRIDGTMTDGGEEIVVFNPTEYDFGVNPPRLDDLRTFTDATTIAFSWDLAWNRPEGDDPRTDPEHHLAHYEVTRRSVDDDSDHATTTVKPAEVLAADDRQGWMVTALRPRFQYVDHFGHESAQEVAQEVGSSAGRTYVYTITPVDVNGTRARPVSVVATRYPNDPPPVPVDTRMVVTYQIDEAGFVRHSSHEAPLRPRAVTVAWTDPKVAPDAPVVAVKTYQLVFRRQDGLPIGSYGIDAATGRSGTRASSARVRPDDVIIEWSDDEGLRSASLTEADLLRLGIDGAVGAVDSWQVLIRTVSPAGVPSPLVPVDLILRFEGVDGAEERRPPRLEWVRPPTDLGALPPRDGIARAMSVHVPQPSSGTIEYLPHPRGVRAVRLRWNQTPSGLDSGLAPLTAGFHVFRVDIDAHPAAALADRTALRRAMFRLDEVRLQPPDELGLVPNTTFNTSEWEAWYPSATSGEGADNEHVPTWDTHHLDWPVSDPEWTAPGLLHPLLENVVGHISEEFDVSSQIGRPLEPSDLDAFLLATAPAKDPYGWAILQHLGLSVTLRLRRRDTGAVVSGGALVSEIESMLEEADPGLLGHLFIERLYQTEGSVGAGPGVASDDDLLAILQLSLRPRAVPTATFDDASLDEEEAVGRWNDSKTQLLVYAAQALSTDMLDELAKTLDESPGSIKTWLQRFLLHGPVSGPGPHLATAYPIPGTPTLTVPDASGRVRYDDRLTDRWAHRYRYVVKPYGRYDRLWEALAESPAFGPDRNVLGRSVDAPWVEPGTGGIDVRVDRTEPIPPPVIVGSSRLDTGSGSRPGSTWEVILAPHPDQVLSERNRTVATRLDHRQVSFTVFRTFAYDRAARVLGIGDVVDAAPAMTPTPIMGRLPARPTDSPANDDPEMGIGKRLGEFGTGGLAIQIQHLPFYYQHRLVAIAQSSTDVSTPVSTTQSEFSYRSPVPTAVVLGAQKVGLETSGPVVRRIRVSLARLWDSLTDDEQRRWPTERPGGGGPLLPGSLPDPDVAYDILYSANGTISVIGRVAIVAEAETDPVWTARRVGEMFAVTEPTVTRDGDANTARWYVHFEVTSDNPANPVSVPIGRKPGWEAGTRPAVGPMRAGQVGWVVAAYGSDGLDGVDHLDAAPVVREALRSVGERLGLTNADSTDDWRHRAAAPVTGAFTPDPMVPATPWITSTAIDGSYTTLACHVHVDMDQLEALDREIAALPAGGKFASALGEMRHAIVGMASRLRISDDLLSVLGPDARTERWIEVTDQDDVVWNGPVDEATLDDLRAKVDVHERWRRPLEAIVATIEAALGPIEMESTGDLGGHDEVDDVTGEPPASIWDQLGDLAPHLQESSHTTVRWEGPVDDATVAALLDLRGDGPHGVMIGRLADAIAGHRRAVPTGIDPVWLRRRSLEHLDQVVRAAEVPRSIRHERLVEEDDIPGVVVIWAGPRPDTSMRTQLEALLDHAGDPVFQHDVRAFLDVLVSGDLASLETGGAAIETAHLPVSPVLGSPLDGSVVVSDWVLTADGFVSDEARDDAIADSGTPADAAAIRLLHFRSLTSDLEGGRFDIRARRGRAAPSRRVPIGMEADDE